MTRCLRKACIRYYTLPRQPSRQYDAAAIATRIHDWEKGIMERCTVELDTITASQYTSMCMTLDRPLPPRPCPLPACGTPLPANWHLAYFPARLRESQLAADGYEPEWQPPPPFDRRVWASGRLKWWPANALRIGDRAQQETRCRSVNVKEGSVGTTVFVTTEQLVRNARGPVLTDERCLAYMSTDVKPSPPRSKLMILMHAARIANRVAEFSRTLEPTPIMLFRYSALTFNSHRIHYDHQYATVEEGYPAPLVHGPLTCTLLLGLLEEQLHHHRAQTLHIDSFTYRAISPLYCGRPLTLHGRWSTSAEADADPGRLKCHLWATNEQGGLAMSGTATLEAS
ncbi:HotDog domain-containing protein [Syncephalis pseudoplumigaleata]|uniref:HotDog domain-containing protein n=1 Tax=Syncephalis pseudoplumigaleata TaxID=1712513 RepID=A0A4P9YXX2_9FUNG|nr:HotDog domain-containing protein [Syncephalis pseudoplumigaleata]|eukprot:RKP24983.1 HotDog domain-containing protein [Syncephalis pseudoplumigaleata]